MKLSQSLIDYKKEIERIAKKQFAVADVKQHKDWKTKPPAFIDNETLYIDSTLSAHKYEESYFHELTHIRFRYMGYPQVLAKQPLGSAQQFVLDKVLSLPEDILVDKYLAENKLTYDKYDYKAELKKIVDIDDKGSYINVGSSTLPDAGKIIVAELMFIRLLIAGEYLRSDESKIKSICIKNLGDDEWKFIKRIADGLRDIFSKAEEDKIILDKAFKLLIKQYGLKDFITVKL